MAERPLLDYVNYRRERAFEALAETEKMLEGGILSASMNRIYYAGFYIVSALLILEGFSTSKHKQLISYFNREYIKTGIVPIETGKILNTAYEKRIVADYHDFVYLTKAQVEVYYKQMKDFVDIIDRIIKMKIS